MSLNVHNAGIWKTVLGFSVKDGGVWKSVQNAYVRDSGVWKQFWSAVSRTFRSGSIGAMVNLSAGSGIRTCTLVLNGNGTISATAIGSPGNWTTPSTAGIGGSYYARYTPSGSLFTTGGYAAGWNSISVSGRAVTISNSGVNVESTGTMSVELSSDQSTVLSTFTVDWDVGKGA